MYLYKWLIGAVLLFTLVFGAASNAVACSVPVFRYALERWPSDPYDVLLLHDGPLSEELSALIETLKTEALENAFDANIWLTDLDVSTEEGAEQAKDILGEIPVEMPRIAVTAPNTPSGGESAGSVIWGAPFDANALRKVLESPVRRELGKRILEGDSAVWLLLESGDTKADDAAAKMIEDMLEEAEKQLQLPDIAPQDMRYLSVGEGVPELKLQFSMMRLSRDDAEEEFLLETLLHSEGDLKDFDQPIVFPIYGRGRALYALVGPGINEDNIAEACMFLTGACSCEVKDLNPGTDLLMSVNWDALMGGRLALNEALPELTGFAGFGAIEATAAVEPAPEAELEVLVAVMDRAQARGIVAEVEAPVASVNVSLLLAIAGLGVVIAGSIFIGLKKG